MNYADEMRDAGRAHLLRDDDIEASITIEHCPESATGEHEPDAHGVCTMCDFSADRAEWWDHVKGGP